MDTTFILITVITIFILSLLVFVGVNVAAKNVPVATRQQGYKNTLIAFAIVAVVVVVLWSLIFWGFRQSAQNSLFLSCVIIMVVAYAWLVYTWVQNKKEAGKALLDLMPYPNKTLNLVTGILFILLGFLGTFTFGARDSKYSWLASSLSGLLIGSYQIVMSFSHLRVHENGIWAYAVLVKWEKIDTFQWLRGNEKVDTLKLKYKGRLPAFMRAGALTVPIEKRPGLEPILEKYLGARVPSPQSPA